jgi:hypothetical protein
MSNNLKEKFDPDHWTCSPTPNPLIPNDLRNISCRTFQEWTDHLANDAHDDLSPNPATQGL